MLGNWEYQSTLTPYDYFIFYTAVGSLQEYFYYPVAVAKQVVNGTNYRFVAIAEPKDANLTTHFVIVDIYQPINSAAYVTRITPI